MSSSQIYPQNPEGLKHAKSGTGFIGSLRTGCFRQSNDEPARDQMFWGKSATSLQSKRRSLPNRARHNLTFNLGAA
jgi:hypothetical protein